MGNDANAIMGEIDVYRNEHIHCILCREESNPKNIISFSSSTESIFFQSNLLQLSIIGGTQIDTDDISMQRQIKTISYQQEIVFVLFNLLFNSVSLCSSLCWVGMASQSQVC